MSLSPLDCKNSTVQIKDQKPFDPTPGTYAELVRDLFCPSH
jgi:hypothetical protein